MNLAFLSVMFLFLFGWAQQSGCGGKEPPLNSKFNLKIKQEAVIKDESLKIEFGSVTEDSRCPEGVTCMWAGTARIKLKVSKAGSETTIELNTGVGLPAVTANGYEIKLLKVEPYPKQDKPIKQDEYVATLMVSRK